MRIFICGAIILGTIYCIETDSVNQDKNKNNMRDQRVDTSKDQTGINTEANLQRRYWLVTSKFDVSAAYELPPDKDEDEKDANLKSKISTLVDQTIHDTERKLRGIQRVKELNKEGAPYRIGFILSLVKKSKDVLNELFNVAVKHREDWKALEQLKIFEFIVHTNVDTTNLVRQMVEIHIQHANVTNNIQYKSRVVLL